jgi:hypothetical protein
MKLINKNNYLGKILLFIFVLLLLTTLSTRTNNGQANAATYGVVGIFCNNNPGTIWQIAMRMKDPVTGNWSGVVYTTTNSSDAHCSGYVNAGGYNFGTINVGSTLQWYTACVDPLSQLDVTYIPLFGYIFFQDVTCSANWLFGNPASCNGVNNKGLVLADAKCPATGGPYCMVGGATDGVICTGAFNGSGSQSCSGTTCKANIPPPPTGLNATPSCNGSAQRMTFGWTNSSGATYYNLTWNNPTGNYNNLTVNPFSPAVNFSPSTLINWSVAACNSSGCSSPATGAKTSGNCSGPTPTTPPSGGWSGMTANPSCNGSYPTVSQATFGWSYSGAVSSYDLTWSPAGATKNTSSTSYIVPYTYNPSCTSGPPATCGYNYGTSVSWFVTAKNASGAVVSTSPTNNFTTANCSSSTINCQQCSGSTCQSYSYSGSSCPTNCGAGCGVSCMLPNIKLNAKKG